MLAPDTLVHGRYRIIRAIGKGGMGAVYEAFDLRLQSPVALKQMIVEGEQLSRAFAREAQLLASLRHQALPRVIDHFVDDQGQFLVMEFIPGDDLATLLQQRGAPFPVDQVLSWADTLLDALGYLHSQQPPVIHRDIKPQNMKLTPRGEIILLDFGLAKGAAAAQTCSMTGSVFGYTPQYAPLEQIKGSGTEPRSDLYSLGATLYNLITGAPPPDALTRAAATITREPDPLEPAHRLNPAVPEDVSAVLSQALALDPAARFANADAMRRALRHARGLPAPLPAVDPTVVIGRQTVSTGVRPAVQSSIGQATMPAGAIREDARPSTPAPPPVAPAQRRGLGVCGVLGIITLAIAIVAIIGVVSVVRQIGQGIQQGIGQVMEQVTAVAPTVIAAQQTLEAVSTQAAAGVGEQATAFAPTLAALQQTAVAAATTVVEEAPLPPGEGRPDAAVPYRLNEVINGEVTAPDVRLGYDFTIDAPQQIFIETRKYARGMEQVKVLLIGPAGGRLLSACLGCGNPGLQSLRRPGRYTLVISGTPGAGTGAFEMQIYDVPPPREFTIGIDAVIAGDQPAPGAGRIETPGARNVYLFEAQAGQRIVVTVTRYDRDVSQLTLTLRAPSGAEVFARCLGCGNPGEQTLPATGVYRLVVGSDKHEGVGAFELRIAPAP